MLAAIKRSSIALPDNPTWVRSTFRYTVSGRLVNAHNDHPTELMSFLEIVNERELDSVGGHEYHRPMERGLDALDLP